MIGLVLALWLAVVYEPGQLRGSGAGVQVCLHFVASLRQSAWYQVRRDCWVLHDSVQSSRAGTLAYRAPGHGYYEVVWWGLVPADPPCSGPRGARPPVPAPSPEQQIDVSRQP